MSAGPILLQIEYAAKDEPEKLCIFKPKNTGDDPRTVRSLCFSEIYGKEKNMLTIILAEMLGMSIVLFALMGIDKFKAKTGRWRVPEKTLFLLAALGGALGGTAGMLLFRHKTKHWYFKYGFPALLIVQIALIVWFTAR